MARPPVLLVFLIFDACTIMALFLTLLSTVLSYFSPAELFPSLAVYHIQQIILIPAVAVSFASMAMRGAKLQWPQYALIVGIWFGVVMSWLSKLALRSALNAFLDFGVLICLFFLVASNAFTVGRVRLFCGVLVGSALIMSVQGILAYHTGYLGADLVLEKGLPGIADARIRGWGFLNDPNDFAQFLLAAVALLGIFWVKGAPLLKAMIICPTAAVLMYAVYLTGSRGAIFGVLAIAFASAAPRVGKVPATVFAVLLFLMMLALQFGGGRGMSMTEGSAAGRIIAWGSGIAQLKSSPLFGSGFGAFTDYNRLTAHNSFVLCFAELGFFGYFFWLSCILVCVWSLETLVGMRQDPVLRQKAEVDADFLRATTALRAALYSFLATAWFLSRTYTLTLYILLALATALIQMRQEAYPQMIKPPRRWIPVTIALQVVSVVIVYVTVRVRNL